MVWEEFTKIFTEMNWVVIVLLVAGIVFCIIEGIVPGFGIWGIIGILCEIAGIVMHAIYSASPWQVFFLILIMTLATVLLFLIFVFSAKHGILGSTPLVENKPAVPYDYGVDKNFIKLIGKRGVVVEGRVMDALSTGNIIEKDSVVRVVKIKDNILYIEKFEGDK